MRIILKLNNQVHLCVLVILLIVFSNSVFAVNYFRPETYGSVQGYELAMDNLISAQLGFDYVQNVVFIEAIDPSLRTAKFCTGYVISRDDVLTSSDCVQSNNKIAPIFVILTELGGRFEGVVYSLDKLISNQMPEPFLGPLSHFICNPQRIDDTSIHDVYLIPGARLAILSGNNDLPLYPTAEPVELSREMPDYLFFEPPRLHDQYIIGFDSAISRIHWIPFTDFDTNFNVAGGEHFTRESGLQYVNQNPNDSKQELSYKSTNWLTQTITGQRVNALMVGGFSNGGPIVSHYYNSIIEREVISLVGVISFSNVAANRTLTFLQTAPLLVTPQSGRYVLFDAQTINIINQIVTKSATAIISTPRGSPVGMEWRV